MAHIPVTRERIGLAISRGSCQTSGCNRDRNR